MKKLLLVLALFTLGVSKAQVVGGYMTLNSSKSFTAGSARITNLVATGTGSIGSTFTTSGAANLASLTVPGTVSVTGTSSLNGLTNIGGITTSTSFSAGTSIKATTTSTFVGQANLQSTVNVLGNETLLTPNTVTITNPAASGTLANLSDALFTTTHFHGLATVGTTALHYDGYPSSSGVSASSGAVGLTYIPFNCTLVGFSHFIGVLGTLGSANTATIAVRINNTTDVTLTAVGQYSAAAQSYSSAALSTTIAAGSYIEMKFTPNCTPTAATNVTQKTTLYFSRR